MSAYYNEIDPYAAQWLRNLIAKGHLPKGDVDERSIVDVRPDDLRPYRGGQCHFFAGIGGWPYALRLAGWPDDKPVWSGSCPCQPFSSAARGRGKKGGDLWPYWFRLIVESRPNTIFGEQVAHAGDWFDGVCDDLEGMGYSIGAAVLPACSVGFDHARFRIFFIGLADCDCKPRGSIHAKMAKLPKYDGQSGKLARENGVSARVGRLRAYGNAIVPQVAVEFIKAAFVPPAGSNRHRLGWDGCPPR